MTGFTALAIGKKDLAMGRIQLALNSGFFKEFESKMQAVLEANDNQPA